MDILATTALGAGLAWASGIRLYAAVFLVGMMGRAGWIDLPEALAVLEHDWVLWASGIMMVGEFIADKVPAFDSIWDAIHTFIRIPAGMLLSAGAFDQYGPGAALAAALVGGLITSGTHLTKSGTRAAINHSPEPVSNLLASTTEDLVTVGGLWLIFQHPLVFLALLAGFLALAIWLLPKLFRWIRRTFRRLFGRGGSPVDDSREPPRAPLSAR